MKKNGIIIYVFSLKKKGSNREETDDTVEVRENAKIVINVGKIKL